MLSVYLRYCHAQPLELLNTKTISCTPTKLPEVIVLAILAYAVRFYQHAFFDDCTEQAILFYTQSAYSIVHDSIGKGNIELSTLQALSLLAHVDFTGRYFEVYPKSCWCSHMTISWASSERMA